MSFDRRLTLIHDGVAARGLEGLVPARRYVDPAALQVSAPAAPLRRHPADEAEQESRLLFGERFDVLLEQDGYSFGQAARDGYVGWVPAEALSGPPILPTHRVTALRTYAFSQANIKTTPVGLYSLNALVTIEATEGRFARAARAGWFVAEHLAPIGTGFETDAAGVALRFLGAPYLWGGRESLGLDCSGLVQQALNACGVACPRDTDMQAAMGSAIEAAELTRGDLVFWKGHVGMMLDEARLVHANGHHMATVVEPLAEAIARIDAAGAGQPTAYRRP
ncbi:MAG: NlpC/P60 family protein [Caulobacter sp.]|nr:NlpC/P60 family protein [Caulobacter sp.]